MDWNEKLLWDQKNLDQVKTRFPFHNLFQEFYVEVAKSFSINPF